MENVKYYYNTKLGCFEIIKETENYEKRLSNNLVEITKEEFNNFRKNTKQGCKATFNVETKSFTYTKIEDYESRKELYKLKKELSEIQQWLKDNDWKVNKIVIGEWTTDDSRWIEYIEERSKKRARQDEINKIIN